MPPTWTHLLTERSKHGPPKPDFSAVKSVWQNPSDILSILMIIGGDVVQCAIAQVVGTRGPLPFEPVAFSFGWVAYSFTAILSSIGDRRLMPAPDYDVTLINVDSGQTRDNKSWNIGRLVRDYEPKREPIIESKPADEQCVTCGSGLTVCFFDTQKVTPFDVCEPDWVFWLGIGVVVVQLGLACIPGALHGNWVVLILTLGGTLLAFTGTALPQWKMEKWAARKIENHRREVVCLTNGNGSRTALVVTSEGAGFKLEDLAGARAQKSSITAPVTFLLATLWIVHLITVESLSDDAWFSLAIGALGMIQNAIAAGAKRTPPALGFHIVENKAKRVHKHKVFHALQAADDVVPGSGLALLDTYFPGGLRGTEIKWREERTAQFDAMKKERKAKEKRLEEEDKAKTGSTKAEVAKSEVSEKPGASSSQLPTLPFNGSNSIYSGMSTPLPSPSLKSSLFHRS